MRSGLTEDQIEARIRSQMPMQEKVRYADFVIDNSGSMEVTRQKVREVFDRLRALADIQ